MKKEKIENRKYPNHGKGDKRVEKKEHIKSMKVTDIEAT